MKNIIATWICIDDKTNGTHFPSAKGNSSDTSVQQIYWRCVCTFFWCARYHNPDAQLMLFSNQNNLPDVDNTSVEEVLKILNVRFYVTSFEYVTPEGYYGEWRNQFYEFSIFKFIANHKDFNENDKFLLLDSDCIITANLHPLYQRLEVQKCITYLIDYDVNYKINGNSRADMKSIFEELMNAKMNEYPGYHGGEFYASTIKVVKKLMDDFYVVWQQLMERHTIGLQKLHEEAHVLSYLFYKNQIEGGQANDFVKRLWTDPSTFRNVEEKDVKLVIWHLPAEKRRGFNRFFKLLQTLKFNVKSIDNETLEKRMRSVFLVPNIPTRRKPYYVAKYLVKKYLAS